MKLFWTTTKHKALVERFFFFLWDYFYLWLIQISHAISFPVPLFACLLRVMQAAEWIHFRENSFMPSSSPYLILLALLNKWTLEPSSVSATHMHASLLPLLFFVYLLPVWPNAWAEQQQLSSGHLKPVQNQTTNQSKTNPKPKTNLPLPNPIHSFSIPIAWQSQQSVF